MMNPDLEKMLENVRSKFFEKDYCLLKAMPDEITYTYALCAARPLRMKSHLRPEIIDQGIVYFNEGTTEDVVREAQEKDITKVYITSIHLK